MGFDPIAAAEILKKKSIPPPPPEERYWSLVPASATDLH